MEYSVIFSDRKTLALQVTKESAVVVRAPYRTPKSVIEGFVIEKERWILKQLEKLNKYQTFEDSFSRDEIADLATQALEYLPGRTAYFASVVGVSYGRITVRNQRTRWGSCSSRKNLNFNCLLMLCPEEVRDYVIIHELCHLKELNHSKRFWSLVARYCPNYKSCKQWLKTEGAKLISRLK